MTDGHQPARPLVSIVVLDYNYAPYVARSIRSALVQTYQPIEVVVIDNGSTDDSQDAIRPYEDAVRVIRIAKNIGQGHGYNAAVAEARGEWLIILDADDTLDADAVESCLRLAAPDTAKVQFPLRLVDAEDRPLGGTVPHMNHGGDVVPIIRTFGHYAGPPGSGNMYRMSAIATYFPVPEADWTIGTDSVPFMVAPFHGRVAVSDRPLGCYRVHQSYSSSPGYFGNYEFSVADDVVRTDLNRDRALALLRERSGIDVPGPFLPLPTTVRYRILSWLYERDRHPYAGDNRRQLMRLMRRSLREVPGYSSRDRALQLAWAAAVLCLPQGASKRLVSANKPSARGVRHLLRRHHD